MTAELFNYDVQKYLKQDRQWTREMRIMRAKSQLRLAKSNREKEFWRDVLEANSND
jgi:hypothetical protein